MVINSKLSSPFAFLLLSFFFLFVTSSLGVTNRDRELCVRRCWEKHSSSSPQEMDECLQECDDYSDGESSRIVLSSEIDEPEKQLRQCQMQCERQKGQHKEKEQCRRQCRETYERQRGGEEGSQEGEGEKENQRQEQEQQEQNPYIFQDQHYSKSLETNEGRVRILQKFHERSRLLRGLKNYRFLSLEANPYTFLLPAHLDADALLYVSSGRGTISLVFQGKRESFNINKGDVMRVHAGTTIYMINRDKNKKLRIVELLQPVSLPDEFQVYYGSAGERPPSFYKAFSPELLATALKADQDRVQRAISQQNKGIIIKASEQQIQAMSQGAEDGMFSFPLLRRSKRVFNLLSKDPSISNRYGRFHEVDANEFQQLQDMDVAVSFANITKGSMQGPFFNSRSTKIAVVVKGEGYMEMACPHVAQQQQQQREGEEKWQGEGQSRGEQQGEQQQQQGAAKVYQRISSPLKQGMLLVVPPGHPTIIVAGNERSLEVVCFEVNAENNWKEALAGDKNFVNAMENEAKELAFGIPAREVDQVFGQQNERFFFPGPRGGRAYA